MTIQQSLAFAVAKLRTSASPILDAEVLLSFVLKKRKEFLFAHPEVTLSRIQGLKFKSLVRKRAGHWPVAYLTGNKEFFGLDFYVTPDVLVPRPDTELLVELAIRAIGDKRLAIRNLVDVGTGSGNIVISVAKALPNKFRFFAIDSSAKALAVARRNARRHGVSKKVKFLRGNLLSPLVSDKRFATGDWLVLANLPYLTERQYRAHPDLKHEPKSALAGGRDGMKYFRELLEQLSTVVARSPDESGQRSNPVEIAALPAAARNDNDTIVLLEHDPSQKNKLKKLVEGCFPRAIPNFYKDLSGRSRVSRFEI